MVTPVNLVLVLFCLAPLWWVIGIDFIVYPAAIFFCLIFFKPKPLDIYEKTLLALIATYWLSLLLALLNDAESGRAIAALYNLSLLGMGLLIHNWMRIYFIHMHSTSIERVMMWLFSFSVMLTMIVFIYHESTGIIPLQFPSLMGILTPPTEGLAGRAQILNFLIYNWYGINHYGPRYYLLAPYVAAAPLAYVVFAVFTLLGAAKKNYLGKVFIVLCLFTLVLLSATRSVLLGIGVGTLLSGLFLLPWRAKILFTVCAVSILGLGFVLLENPASIVSDYRVSSNELRLLSYAQGFHQVMENNPLFGLGIKPMDQELAGIPTGSHSTFISALTKGGLVGLLLCMSAFYWIPAHAWLKTLLCFKRFPQTLHAERERAFYLLFLQCVLWVWMFTEDVDAPALAAACLFTAQAAISAFHTRIKQDTMS